MNSDLQSAFVTGGTGFIGHNLIRRLSDAGCSVHVLIRPESDPGPVAHAPGVHVHIYDGTVDSVVDAVTGSRPDCVFHLATRYHPQHSPGQLDDMIRANIQLGIHVLEAMASAGISCLVNAGSAWQHYRDQDYCPVNLYAAMKQAFEDILAYYIDAHGVRAVSLRIFDTYGPDDHRRKLVPLLLEALRAGTAIDMSTGESRLDLLYIDDVLDAFLEASAISRNMTATVHEVFTLASGERHSVREIVEIISRLSDTPLTVNWGALPKRDRDVLEPWTKGRRLPGWAPKVSLESGLRRLLGSGD